MKSKYFIIFLIIIFFGKFLFAQSPELETTTMKIGHLWLGVKANGYRGNFFYQSGFFPNDFDVLGQRGQYPEAYTGVATLATTYWLNPADSLEPAAVYSYADQDFLPIGKVVKPLTNYLRYKFTEVTANGETVDYPLFGNYDPENPEFQNHTFDEIVEVTDSTVLGIEVSRKLLSWTQSYNNDYVIADMIFTNTSSDTLDTLYINLKESAGNVFFSNGSNPAPSGITVNPEMTWQHYYGAKPGDSMRVFYEYSADNPQTNGDDMGASVKTQQGRLLFPNMSYYTILHASEQPYFDEQNDVDDPLQPKITYIGKDNQIPYNKSNDDYGSANFYAISGKFSDDYPKPGRIPGTHHGINNDELGISDYSNFVSGELGGISNKFSSFGPYKFLPGQKIHIVIASGYTGIGFEKGQEIGKKWLNGTLQDPPNMPNPVTGWLPENFKFPDGATEMDKRKDRWISSGIDSVMLSAWRAKWNFEHNYNIPQAPPPPEYITITGFGDGVEIKWSDKEAENMPNFMGYRIMTRISNADTIYYSELHRTNASDKAAEHVFRDTTAIPSTNTFYYVQAIAKIDENDINADPTTRGKLMYSSRALVPNGDVKLSVNPPRFSQDDLSKIRIVPNPYNINDPELKNRFSQELGDQITFYNLPPVCKIKIYTENGDLVQTVDHSEPVTKGGSEQWDMTTSSQQVINSGVYIAVFQKPNGETSFQKFVVVR